jgi:hypothetical protein
MLDIRFRYGFAFAALLLPISPMAVHAQAPAAARQLGTVKAINGSTITLTTSAGADVTVTVVADAPVLQLPPGSTDLKAATPAKLEDVAVGDRVLASGKAGDAAGTLTASRIILMKSTDITARNAAEQRDWQMHGLGGLVRTVDGSTVTVVSGAKTLKIDTTPTTSFKRYAPDSVAFADVKPSALGEIHPGDQLRARGALADDHLSMTADEVVSGTFENLSGLIASVDAAAQTLTLKDLTTKKTVTVQVTAKSDLRALPVTAAAAFAARNRAGGAGAGGAAGAGSPPAGGAAGSGSATDASAAHPRNAGFDLSQMLSRLPTQTLADLKAGQAVMIVASAGSSGNPTAITLLSGVDAILSATPAGQQPITLSPWNIGSEPEGASGGGGAPGGSH